MDKHTEQINIGDFVKLNDKAISRFYGTDECASFYIIGGQETVDKIGIVKAMKTKDFVDYVADVYSFQGGIFYGRVKSFYSEEKLNDACVVEYFCLVDLNWKTCRHQVKNLEKYI